MAEKQVLREVTPEVVAEAREMIGAARYGALATIGPEDGWPVATRVGLALFEGEPLILVSALAAHTGALRADPRCSLLIGEVGKGDALAHPRVTLKSRAEEIEREAPERLAAREAYLAANPKAALYADLRDFAFMRLRIEGASFNGGFGKAYALSREELLS
jgi:putative heme iron utilization protein